MVFAGRAADLPTVRCYELRVVSVPRTSRPSEEQGWAPNWLLLLMTNAS